MFLKVILFHLRKNQWYSWLLLALVAFCLYEIPMITKQQSAQNKATVYSAWVSFILSLVVFGFKFIAYQMTHSTAIFSDAMESVVNVVASFAALFVMKAVAEPADEEHPYGHGKLEYFSAAFEGGLIAFAAIAIGVESIRALIHPKELTQPDIGLWVMTAAAVVNLGLGLHLKSVGKKYKSEALLASGMHVISDVWTTVAVLVGLGIVWWTGISWIDPLFALLVAFHLIYSGYQIVRQAIGALIDEVEPSSLLDLCAAFQKCKKSWVIDIHQLKTIRSGHFHHIDAHLVVPEFWDVGRTHEEMTRFEADVVSVYPFDGEIAFHLDPCERKYCHMCEFENCSVRKVPCTSPRIFEVEKMIRAPEGLLKK